MIDDSVWIVGWTELDSRRTCVLATCDLGLRSIFGLFVIAGLVVRDFVGRRETVLADLDGWISVRLGVVAEATFSEAVAFLVAIGMSGAWRDMFALDGDALGADSTFVSAGLARRGAAAVRATSGLGFKSGAGVDLAAAGFIG